MLVAVQGMQLWLRYTLSLVQASANDRSCDYAVFAAHVLQQGQMDSIVTYVG
jgi:hypothetical protein